MNESIERTRDKSSIELGSIIQVHTENNNELENESFISKEKKPLGRHLGFQKWGFSRQKNGEFRFFLGPHCNKMIKKEIPL